MNIAIVGYGKMGRIIEEVALSRGHAVDVKIDLNNLHDFNKDVFAAIDVTIEFTGPHTAFDNVMKCLDMKMPVVCGSTGWLERLPEIENQCAKNNGAFLYASNFSVGVNIFFEINRKLAELMSHQKSYVPQITEIHHTHKKDAPSGTAISLASDIMAAQPQLKTWVNHASMQKDQLPIISERIDPAPGTHHVRYRSEIDDIEIIHTAHNRNGFALGAVLAAEFLQSKQGVFTMKDVLQF